MPTPTDLKILKTIYRTHIDDFRKHELGNLERSSVIYVPIDVEAVAKKLSTDPQLLFGRLRYDIDKRYGYTQDDGSKVHLFTPKVGDDRNAVNFPLLAGVIGQLSERSLQFWLPVAISMLALGFSLYGVLC